MAVFDPAAIAALRRDLDGIPVEDNPAIVRSKSRDFFWYSPVLKRQLDHVTADLVATPRSQDEVVQVLAAAFAHGVPVTCRGAGTGNYGQAMPLVGGLVLSLAAMNRVTAIRPGAVVAEAGAIMAEMDRETRAHSRQELRFHPSTYRTATIGGFIAGGSGGVGSIRWGGLRHAGNVLRLRIVTMEAEPRVLDLAGDDILKACHAYGTNGVITEVEMPLSAAHDWVEVMLGFDEWMAAVRFGDELGHADGVLVKEVAPIAAPAPYDYFLRHRKFLRRDHSVVLVMVADIALPALLLMASRRGAEVLYRSDLADAADIKALPPIYELAWNHTTLRALRVDPSITYLQVNFPFPGHVEKVAATTRLFGDEVMGHLEVIRSDGRPAFAALPLVRFSTEERLCEIIRLYEENGCRVFDPHRYTLEEGGMKRTDAAQLAFKRQADPKGLLNPGKMIGWESPDFDLAANRAYVFPGLQPAG